MGDVIRLLDSCGERILDSVSAEYEDSFCLEEFGDLCKMHWEAEPKGKKSFIIARVQTWDPKQPEKDFYSYYNAYHLNKVLFQTQMYLGKKFIHRLHVLNPLTNSDIIGNVQYFMVKMKDTSHKTDNIVDPSSASTSPAQLQTIKETHEDDAINIVIDTTGSSSMQSPQEQGKSQSPKRPKSPLKIVTSPSEKVAPTPTIVSSAQFAGPLSAKIPATPSVMDIEQGKQADWTLASHAVAEISEDDEEGDLKIIGNMSRKVSLALSRTTRSIVGRKSSVAPAAFDAEKAGRLPPFYEVPAPKSPSIAASPMSATGSMNEETALRVVAKHPSGPIRPNDQKKAKVPAGVITRFAVPVPSEEILTSVPKTTKGNRRALSYRNALSATGQPASFEDWLQMIREEKNLTENELNDAYDIVKPFAGHNSASPKKSQLVESQETQVTLSHENSKDASLPKADPPETSDHTIYDAVLFATDNDFLEMSKIRAIFRDNAITPDDAKLFEMPAYTGEEAVAPPVEILEDPFLCECCSRSPEELENASAITRCFYQHKCYIFVVTLIIIIIVIITVSVFIINNASSGPGGKSGS